MESKIWILVVGAAALVCAARGGLFALLVLDVVCAGIFSQDWYLAGLSLDATDVVFGMMAVLALTGGVEKGMPRLREVPYVRAWVVLLVLWSLAYVAAPGNASRMTDPVRIAYQLYRYCLKPLALYPLTFMIVGTDARRARTLVTWVLVMGCYMALSTVGTYLLGGPTTDLITGKNKFAGSLIAPTIACLALFLAAAPGRRRTLLLGGLGVLGVGLVAAGSRGAIVAAGAAGLALTLSLARYAGGRRRIVRLLGWAALGIVVVLLLVPNVADLPGARLISELQKGADVDNLTWRMQLRWPHFWGKVMQHPWLGIGTDRDLSLADFANTPHNGYLSLAMIRGLPATVIVAWFGVRTVLRARRVFMRKGETTVRLLALGVAAAIVGLLTHNLVESTLTTPYVSKLYWLFAGLGAAAPALRMQASREPAGTPAPQPRVRRNRRGAIPIRPLPPHRDVPAH